MRIARPSSAHAGVVDEHEDGPEALAHLARRRPDDLLGVADVGLHVAAVAARGVATFQPSVAQALGDRGADAARAAGDERAAAPSGADMHALLPAHDARAPHEAGAEGGQARRSRRASGGPSRSACGQGERDRGRRRVGHAVDVDDDLLARQAELVGGRLDDARRWPGGRRRGRCRRRSARRARAPRASPRPCARRRGGRPRGPPCAACARRARRRAGRPARRRRRARSRRQPSSSSPPATTTAPAPSPKSTAVPRSSWSVMRG